MQRTIIDGLIFVGGLTVGFIAGARIAKKKLEEDKQNEIMEIRNIHAAMLKERSTEEYITEAYNKMLKEKEEAKVKEKETKEKEKEKNKAISEAVNKIFGASSILPLQAEKNAAKSIIKNSGYSSDTDGHPTDEDEEDEDDDQPILEKISRNEEKNMEKSYVISPSEFGEMDYEEIELTYYADGILTEGRDIVDDPDDIVGLDSLSTFGEYEEDAVYVRNDARRCDYVILKDLRRYSELPKSQRR